MRIFRSPASSNSFSTLAVLGALAVPSAFVACSLETDPDAPGGDALVDASTSVEEATSDWTSAAGRSEVIIGEISADAHSARLKRVESRGVSVGEKSRKIASAGSARPGVAPLFGEAPEVGEVVILTVQLAEPGFEFSRFQGRAPTERTPLVEERKAQLKASNGAALAGLAALGARITGRFWLTNTVEVEVPREKVEELRMLPEVEGVRYRAPDTDEPMAAYDGVQVRGGIRATALIDQGIRGENGNKGTSGNDIRIAISEKNGLVRGSHLGFKDTSGGSSRVKKRYDCTPDGCAAVTANTPSSDHATLVAAAAAGSIEQNQDPNYLDASAGYPGSASQVARSGAAPEALIYSYSTNGANSYTFSLEQAVADGADVFNRSAGSASQECEDVDTRTFGDDGGANLAVKNATTAGLLIIHATGNGHDAGDTCTVHWPSWRPEVVGVGALASTNSATAYSSVNMSGSSSRGLARTDQGLTAHPAVGLTAPGCVTGLYSAEADDAYFGQKCGTSVAAPIVSGAAALLKQAFYDNGAFSGTVQDARRMLVNLLLMGDGWQVPALGNTGSETAVGVSRTSGYGRIRLNTPQTLVAPWRWSSGVSRVRDGEAIWWSANGTESNGNAKPMPASTTQLKWALTWFPDSLNSTGEMDAQIWTASCSATDPRTGTLVVQDTSQSFRKRLQAAGSAVAGKCTWFLVNAHETSDGSDPVYSAFYYHAGDPSTH